MSCELLERITALVREEKQRLFLEDGLSPED
jgi:hypothetical protein